MQNLLLAATIPLDGYAWPILFNDGALTTRSPMLRNLDCSPVIYRTPLYSDRAHIFASAGEIVRFGR
jgi:hypothetical protein